MSPSSDGSTRPDNTDRKLQELQEHIVSWLLLSWSVEREKSYRSDAAGSSAQQAGEAQREHVVGRGRVKNWKIKLFYHVPGKEHTPERAFEHTPAH